MIVSRAPFRITLGGGGTDLPAFYSKYGGCVTSMAIDKFIYVSFKKHLLADNIRLQYLETENVKQIKDLKHNRARATLERFEMNCGFEINSIGDLPSKSGLGSSSSYLVSLINCLNEFKQKNMSKYEIANLACKIEIEDLKEPVGKQDQFISSYGGIKTFDIDTNGKVKVTNINLDSNNLKEFVNRCPIYYTGIQRSASKILKSQTTDEKNFHNKMLQIKDLGYEFVDSLKNYNFDRFGILLDKHWTLKKKLSKKMSHPKINHVYENLKTENLILGGKLIGAGGGGFLMVYAPKEVSKVDDFMAKNGLLKIDYSIDTNGVKTIYSSRDGV